MTIGQQLQGSADALDALLEYANGITGQSDADIGAAIRTLSDGYGQGGGDDSLGRMLEGALTDVQSDASRIKSYAFNSDYGVRTANFPKATRINSFAFMSAVNLRAISCPLVTVIEQQAFRGARSLADISFPNCTTLEQLAFYGETSIQKFEMPNLKSIGSQALSGIKATAIVIGTNQNTVCQLADGSNRTIPDSVQSIYVPDALVDAYKTTGLWTNFADRIKGISTKPEEE